MLCFKYKEFGDDEDDSDSETDSSDSDVIEEESEEDSDDCNVDEEFTSDIIDHRTKSSISNAREVKK